MRYEGVLKGRDSFTGEWRLSGQHVVLSYQTEAYCMPVALSCLLNVCRMVPPMALLALQSKRLSLPWSLVAACKLRPMQMSVEAAKPLTTPAVREGANGVVARQLQRAREAALISLPRPWRWRWTASRPA